MSPQVEFFPVFELERHLLSQSNSFTQERGKKEPSADMSAVMNVIL